MRSTDDLMPAALTYARAGLPIFPVTPRGKRPRTEHGLLDATTDSARVASWWGRHPDANIGVVTGAVSRLVVVDVDGDDGHAALLDVQREAGQVLPPTRWSRTGGGWHGWFRHPGGVIPNSAGRIAPRVDVRGDGGYVVAPPSIHASGAIYRWVGERVPLAPVPPWLLELIRPPRSEQQRHAPVALASSSRYAAAAVERETAEVAVAPEGGRNHRLNRAAYALGTLVGAAALEESAVISALMTAARVSGLDDREAERTITSGLRAGIANPRVSAA